MLLSRSHQYVKSNKFITAKQSLVIYWKTLLSSYLAYDSFGWISSLIVVCLLDVGVLWFMLEKVKYTNIDWTAYMEQAQIYGKGERNYFNIRGDTGPLVYPAGHLYIFSFLRHITDGGSNVRLAQQIYAALYFCNQLLIYSLFAKSGKIGGGVLILMLSLSHRIHSIYVLRLFNDPMAMFLFYISANFFIRRKFAIGCVFYSLAVSVKMNVLLFAPAIFFVLLFSMGIRRTIVNLGICALVQLLVGAEFLLANPVAYLGRAFELGRVFQFRWSVNWSFVGEELFLSTNFHLILLVIHLALLCCFAFFAWFREHGGILKVAIRLLRDGQTTVLSAHEILFALFTANLSGIVFARSIHFQFYSWYYHSLFYLLYSMLKIELTPPHFPHLQKQLFQWIGLELKRRQRNWATKQPDFQNVQTLREECGYRIADRVFDLTKYNEVAVDLGCGLGHIAPHLIRENIGTLIQCDMSEDLVRLSKGNDEFPVLRLCADEELVPFRNDSVDLIVSALSAHWINDLPGWFQRCFDVLRPDGAIIGGMLAGDTLHELRVSLQLAEMERLGGLGAHISPFVQPQDIGGLLGRAGFKMITLDLDELEIGYPNMFALLYDLQLMGESNASRKRSPLRRDVLMAAQCIYAERYGKEVERLPATFQMIGFIAWKPGPLMPQPARRGSQNVSLQDLGKFMESRDDFLPPK